MKIQKEITNCQLTVIVEGRLDTITSPQLEQELQESLPDITNLILDFDKLEYISSAGLRVILAAWKTMNQQGNLIVKNVRNEIKGIFDMTGFSNFLTIQ